jgi:acetyl esterase/lipase
MFFAACLSNVLVCARGCGRCLQRSDSTDFYDRCLAAGRSDVELEVWPRMWHCFQQYSEGCGVAADDVDTSPQPLREAVVATDRIARWVQAHIDRRMQQQSHM